MGVRNMLASIYNFRPKENYAIGMAICRAMAIIVLFKPFFINLISNHRYRQNKFFGRSALKTCTLGSFG